MTKPRGKLNAALAEIEELQREVAGLRAELAAIDKAIVDRGVCERNCNAPLPERVDALIVEQRSAEYWRASAKLLMDENASLRAGNVQLAERLAAASECLGRAAERMDRAAQREFSEHLSRVAKEVAGWPEWKRNMLGEQGLTRAVEWVVRHKPG